MEKEGFISLIITGKTLDGSLSPKDIDINETKELLTDMEALMFPTKSEKEDRPKVSYEVQKGSVKNIFFIPIAKAIMFTALMSEVGRQGTTELLEPQAASIIDKWQQRSYKTSYEYSITSSIQPGISFLVINKNSKFIAPQTDWVSISIYLYGEIYEEGGLSKSNLHILTDRYGRLTVAATKDQLTSGTNKLYNIYGLWVKGKQNISNGSLKDLSLIDFITHNQNYDQIVLNTLIDKASANWKKIKNKDEWLIDIRGGNND